MPSPCEQIKIEYNKLQTLTKRFLEAKAKANVSRDLFYVKQLRAEWEVVCESLESKFYVSEERAAEILGRENVLGQEAMKATFGVRLLEIPRIPFKKEELERAKELNQFLVLRASSDPDGQPLTMQRMNELIQPKFTETNQGKILFDTHWYKDEPFFTEDAPPSHWALVSKELLPNSTGKNYLEQTELLVEFIKNKVFKNQPLPQAYQDAIAEFEQKKPEIQELMEKKDWQKASEALASLKLNRPTASARDVLYDFLVYFQVNNIRLPKELLYVWTKTRSSSGDLVALGYFDRGGANVDGWDPGDRDGDSGVLFSRS